MTDAPATRHQGSVIKTPSGLGILSGNTLYRIGRDEVPVIGTLVTFTLIDGEAHGLVAVVATDLHGNVARPGRYTTFR